MGTGIRIRNLMAVYMTKSQLMRTNRTSMSDSAISQQLRYQGARELSIHSAAFDRILSFIIFSAICFLALSATSLFRLKEPVTRWWYPAAPIVFLLGCGLINLLILMHDPVPALLGLLVVSCGDPVRRLFFSTTEPLGGNRNGAIRHLKRNSQNATHSTSRRFTRHPRRNGLSA